MSRPSFADGDVSGIMHLVAARLDVIGSKSVPKKATSGTFSNAVVLTHVRVLFVKKVIMQRKKTVNAFQTLTQQQPPKDIVHLNNVHVDTSGWNIPSVPVGLCAIMQRFALLVRVGTSLSAPVSAIRHLRSVHLSSAKTISLLTPKLVDANVL